MKKSLLLIIAIAASMSSAHSLNIPGLPSSAKELVNKAKNAVVEKYQGIKSLASDALKDLPGAFSSFKETVGKLDAGEKVQVAAGYLHDAAQGITSKAAELVNSFVVNK